MTNSSDRCGSSKPRNHQIHDGGSPAPSSPQVISNCCGREWVLYDEKGASIRWSICRFCPHRQPWHITPLSECDSIPETFLAHESYEYSARELEHAYDIAYGKASINSDLVGNDARFTDEEIGSDREDLPIASDTSPPHENHCSWCMGTGVIRTGLHCGVCRGLGT